MSARTQDRPSQERAIFEHFLARLLEKEQHQIVSPTRVDGQGRLLVTNVLHESRERASNRARRSAEDDDADERFYKLNIKGREEILSLRLNPELTLNDLTVEFWSFHNATKEKRKATSKCHYHGEIEGKNSQLAIRLPVEK